MPWSSEVLEASIHAWVSDPEADVVHAEQLDDRWAVRMRQTVREATTVWWHVGERTIGMEAYVLPAPDQGVADILAICLKRNLRTWRVKWALDGEGAVVLTGRIGRNEASHDVLDEMLAEVYEQVEITFPIMVRLAFPSREKSP